MTKTDTRRELAELYTARKNPTLLEVPPLRYLMIDGRGDPNTAAAYAQALQALYSVSYGAKFTLRKQTGDDVTVMPLEGLWWADDVNAFSTGDRDAWQWTMMILQPEIVTAELIEQARAAARDKIPAQVLAQLRLDTLAEGRCAQILHIGPYSAEGPTIQRLHDYVAECGLNLIGRHHEIYLSDPRRTAAERLRTIVRHSVSG